MLRFFVLLLSVLFVGCVTSHGERMESVNPLGWGIDDDVEFSYDNCDTTVERTINLLVRWDDTFTLKELPCIIRTVAPDSTQFVEQVRFPVRRGTVDKSSTGFRNSQINYRRRVVLSQKGVYRFIIQNTTVEPVVGVWAVGLNIVQ